MELFYWSSREASKLPLILWSRSKTNILKLLSLKVSRSIIEFCQNYVGGRTYYVKKLAIDKTMINSDHDVLVYNFWSNAIDRYLNK